MVSWPMQGKFVEHFLGEYVFVLMIGFRNISLNVFACFDSLAAIAMLMERFLKYS